MTTVIVGGGLAGLAAAVTLAARGSRVTLLESRSFCGGRAYSYPAPVVGDTIDNGQHVLLGCYHDTLHYLSTIGSRNLLDIQPRLAIPFLEAGDAPTWLDCPPLPTPLHLLAGIARLCNFHDAWALIRARHELMGDPEKFYLTWDQMSCADWLTQLKISKEGIRRFWEPLILAVMNDAPARVSAAPFLAALHRIASGPRQAASLAISRVGLSDLFVAPALRFLDEKGCTVRSGVSVAAMTVQHHDIVSLTTATGEVIPTSRVIFAIPPRALGKILEAVPGTIVLREMLGCWEDSPILSVYLWFDRPVMDHPVVGLWGSPFHWAFNRPGENAHGLTLVVSGASDFGLMNREDVIEKALAVVQQFFPKSHGAQLIHRMVSREPHATVRLSPGTQRLRAAIRSPWPNAQFIGDWTDTRLPATIEGAIASALSTLQAPRPSAV